MGSARRLKKELMMISKESLENCSASLVNDDLYHWKASILGPEGTPYADGTFELDIKFPAEYPFKPPQVKFETKIYHRHIIDGEICIDILYSKWRSTFTVNTVMLAISTLLTDPHHQDPDFAVTAREWTVMYARNTCEQDYIS